VPSRSSSQCHISTLMFFLMSLPVLVAAQEREAANAPVETVSMGAVVAFAVIFIGMIVGFFIYLFVKKEEPAKK
jgi:uncharacterized membrane protein (DUF485 family)